MQRRLKRYICCLLAVLCLYSSFPCRSLAISTSATSAILMDADSGRILYEQNADAKMLIASTTKILTALIAIESCGLSETVTVSRNAAGTEGSAMYLTAGEQLTLETLLYGVMLCSGNDAAVAVAEHVAGSCEKFAARMNERAEELGMEHSSFANPNGLDDENHYSTARDMALLACAALENETLMRIASTRSITIGGRTMTNHNKQLSRQAGCLGLKTGYTRAAGRTLVSCAEQNGQRLVAVTLQDGNDWADHQSLYEYGFSAYPQFVCGRKGQQVCDASVAGGIRSRVPLVAAVTVSWPLGQGERVETAIRLDRPLTAPLTAGESVGEAVFTVNGREVGRTQLLAGADVLPRFDTAIQTLKTILPG